MAAVEERIPTRERILYASAELFRRQGYAGTGLKEVVAAAEAPFGSLYHHFPGGKSQLAEEVLRIGGAFFLSLYERIADSAPDFASGIQAFFGGAGETLAATDYADACPIATVAGETASSNETLRVVCAEVFESWIDAATARYLQAGGRAEDARQLALSILALLEGAFLFSRTLRSLEPMAAAAEAAALLAAAHVPAAGGKAR